MKTVKIRNVVLGEGIPKICVPIVEKNREDIVRAAAAYKSMDIDLIEWRADWYEDVEKGLELEGTLASLRETLGDMPLLFTIRTSNEGGELTVSPEAYEALLLRAARTGTVDAVDVEMMQDEGRCSAWIHKLHEEGVAVLASNHDFDKTPVQGVIKERLLQMFCLNADIAKIAVMPKTEQDVWNLMAAAQEVADRGIGPVVTMSMGELGVISRMTGEHTGSVMTFGAAGKASAPGQISVDKLRDILHCIHEKKTNLFLIGFMGCGKSTIAASLERLLGVERMEMDQQIVEQEGRSIADIFADQGETYFRSVETNLLRGFSDRTGVVVSCGGGVPLREENIRIMKENGLVVFLDADPEIIYDRVKDSTDRPILNGHMNVEYIGELMDKRRPWYEKAADVCIAVGHKSATEVCVEILEHVAIQHRKWRVSEKKG